MREKHHPSGLLRDILEFSQVQGFDLLLLLVMAEYSYLAKVEIGQKELAKLAHMSDRQVRRCLENLIQKGQITLEKAGNGRGHASRYHVHVTPYL
jgi:hypothetical protein